MRGRAARFLAILIAAPLMLGAAYGRNPDPLVIADFTSTPLTDTYFSNPLPTNYSQFLLVFSGATGGGTSGTWMPYVQVYFDHIDTWVTICEFAGGLGLTSGAPNRTYSAGIHWERQNAQNISGTCKMPIGGLFWRLHLDEQVAGTWDGQIIVYPSGGNP